MPVVVETVTKSSTIKTFAAAKPLHDSDASKVTSKGAGLQSAQLNKDAAFTVDTSRAGRSTLCTQFYAVAVISAYGVNGRS